MKRQILLIPHCSWKKRRGVAEKNYKKTLNTQGSITPTHALAHGRHLNGSCRGSDGVPRPSEASVRYPGSPEVELDTYIWATELGLQ